MLSCIPTRFTPLALWYFNQTAVFSSLKCLCKTSSVLALQHHCRVIKWMSSNNVLSICNNTCERKARCFRERMNHPGVTEGLESAGAMIKTRAVHLLSPWGHMLWELPFTAAILSTHTQPLFPYSTLSGHGPQLPVCALPLPLGQSREQRKDKERRESGDSGFKWRPCWWCPAESSGVLY